MKIGVWSRILLAGISLEFLYGFFLIYVLSGAQQAFSIPGIAVALGMMMFGGWWVGKNADLNKITMSSLVSVVSILFYNLVAVYMMLKNGESLIELIQAPYLAHHIFKIIAAALGGLIAKTTR